MVRIDPSAFLRAAAAAVLAVVLSLPAAADPVQPLVSPQWLKERLSDPKIVVLDIRSALDGGGVEAYRKAHIPGAIHSDYDKAGWRVTRGDVPFMLPSLAQLEKLIGETGIDEDDHVVVVPAGVHATDFGSAARVYWTLKVAGHPRVSILDGGVAAWVAAGYAVESGAKAPSPKIFTATLNKTLLAAVGDVETISGTSAANSASQSGPLTVGSAHAATLRPALLDGRPASFFAGKERAPSAKAYGHIPGAINVDSAAFYDPAANRLRSKSELEAIARSVPAGPVVSYCNTGHWAATNWFVLSEVLGRKQVTLFDGSMAEWTADGRRPVASQRTRWDDVKKALGFGS
ncbi:MAG: sulfurtransferase [Alphaproteobacteria bacterium]|nr:sulfurtransferase [Alphaproteobacteria bacterium]